MERTTTDGRYCTLPVSEPDAPTVKVQVLVSRGAVQSPDQRAVRPLLTRRVTLVPIVKLAEAVDPTGTFRPAGVEEMDSPPRPVAIRVTVAVGVPQTLAIPVPPQVWGATQTPQVRVPPQPSEIVPQFFP